MELLRTPAERFADLPDFPYEPHYVDVLGGKARMHYIDEGEGETTLLCLHGEPSWSFLYRHIIAELKDDYRIIAPDLLGFGRSDKPTKDDDHTYFMHHRTLFELLEELDLQHVTLVCQDWGGILGLPLAMKNQDRFERLVIMNTGLPTGDIALGEGFKQWVNFAKQAGRSLQPGIIVNQATVSELSDAVIDAYDAPFPDETYRAGVAALPLRVPQESDDPGAPDLQQTRERLKEWRKPALVMFSDQDPVTRGGDKFFRKLIPSASEQPAITIEDAGHFLQEDKGQEIARHIRDFIQRTPNPTAGIEVIVTNAGSNGQPKRKETVTKNLDKDVVEAHETEKTAAAQEAEEHEDDAGTIIETAIPDESQPVDTPDDEPQPDDAPAADTTTADARDTLHIKPEELKDEISDDEKTNPGETPA